MTLELLNAYEPKLDLRIREYLRDPLSEAEIREIAEQLEGNVPGDLLRTRADATDLGYAYLIMRSMYPVIWAVLGGEKGQPEAGSMFTFPQYAINLYEVNKQKTRAHRATK